MNKSLLWIFLILTSLYISVTVHAVNITHTTSTSVGVGENLVITWNITGLAGDSTHKPFIALGNISGNWSINSSTVGFEAVLDGINVTDNFTQEVKTNLTWWECNRRLTGNLSFTAWIKIPSSANFGNISLRSYVAVANKLNATNFTVLVTKAGCIYSLSLNPSSSIKSGDSYTWNITAKDSSSGSCPSPITYDLSESHSGSCIIGLNDSIKVNRNGSIKFNLTINTTEYCMVNIIAKDPTKSSVAKGDYALLKEPCVDTDVSDTKQKGVCLDINGQHDDSCVGNSVIEWSCLNDTCQRETIRCSFGCKDGVCLEESAYTIELSVPSTIEQGEIVTIRATLTEQGTPVQDYEVRLTILDPTGDEIIEETKFTDDYGKVAYTWDTKGLTTGNYDIYISSDVASSTRSVYVAPPSAPSPTNYMPYIIALVIVFVIIGGVLYARRVHILERLTLTRLEKKIKGKARTYKVAQIESELDLARRELDRGLVKSAKRHIERVKGKLRR